MLSKKYRKAIEQGKKEAKINKIFNFFENYAKPNAIISTARSFVRYEFGCLPNRLVNSKVVALDNDFYEDEDQESETITLNDNGV